MPQANMSLREDNRKIFSLAEVTRSIQKTLAERYTSSFWVKAEMNKLNLYKHSGHCYPDMVEKFEGRVIAQIRCVLWGDTYIKCNKKFQRVLHEPLRDGIKILFLAKITFDPVHGLSLVISDIDPAYTLGDLEREKQESIQRLIEEGIIDRNKNIPFPRLPQRIAIISVETSKGYADFSQVLNTNSWGYKFFTMLFPALLQGDRSVESITYQLNRIRTVQHHFDVVAIIRGGGGDIGLSSFNHYDLAKEIALFPLPVITGIGHATNETVSEIVSNHNAITPTKLAEHLLQHFHNFSAPLIEAERIIHEYGFQILGSENERFNSEIKIFRSVCDNLLLTSDHKIRNLSVKLSHEAKSIFQTNQQRLRLLMASIDKSISSSVTKDKYKIENVTAILKNSTFRFLKGCEVSVEHAEKNIENLRPENVMKRGYTITLHNGRAITTVSGLNPSDKIVTRIADGEVESTITQLKENSNE